MRNKKISFTIDRDLHWRLDAIRGEKTIGEFLIELIEESLEFKKLSGKVDDQAILLDIMKKARGFIETAPKVLYDNIFLKKIRENIALLNSGEIKLLDKLSLDILPPRSSFHFIANLKKEDVLKMKLDSCLANDVAATNISVFLEKPLLVKKEKFSLEMGEKFLVVNGAGQYGSVLSFGLYKVI